ncbi:MAG: hypothetical protein II943_13100 [Victivallales bacterium]|nr:hypothetical protein [Victivallales bacterium]
MSILAWLNQKEREGTVCFSRSEIQRSFPQKTSAVLDSELYQLCKRGILANVHSGFYVKIPVRYASNRVVPPEYYIDQLMHHIGRPYYVSLLSAAQIFGAGHQTPQRFCVFTTRPVMQTSEKKNPIVFWCYRREIPSQLLIQRNSETAAVKFSIPELTAVDIVQYSQYIGGFSRCATVLAELLESTDFANANPYLFRFATLAAFQRLGYIAEDILGEQEQADALYQRLREANSLLRWTALSSKRPVADIMPRSSRWKIIVNAKIEVDDL